MSMLGTLDEISVEQVLRMLIEGRKTGLLRVTDGNRQALIYMDLGRITHAAASRLEGKKAVWDIMGWQQGSVTFLAGDHPFEANVSESTPALIEEALREGGRFHRMREIISSDRLVFQLAAVPKDDQTRFEIGIREWRVIRAVDGVRDVRGVVEATQLSREETQAVLFELIERGFVERSEPPKALKTRTSRKLGREAIELSDSLLDDWKRGVRFTYGVFLVEARSPNGRNRRLSPQFAPGPPGEAGLSRDVFEDLSLQEGQEIYVRPVA
ncbi:MAG: DUF4388 domain-containing protein [Vicinamibacteria bacterium]|nr:DUF4388 domain-containing protein [Vicinamibacteria bacterium]